jgi:hypothetical protein
MARPAEPGRIEIPEVLSLPEQAALNQRNGVTWGGAPFRPDLDDEAGSLARSEARDVPANPLDRPRESPFEPTDTGAVQQGMQQDTAQPPPPPPPGMLPPADAMQAKGAPGRPTPMPGGGMAGPQGPAGLSPDRQYEKDLRKLEERDVAASGLEQQGIQGQADAYRRGGVDRANWESIRADEEKKNKDEIDHAQGRLDLEGKSRVAEINDRNAKHRAMHVDPGKWYKDRGTAGSVLAALASAAGAFGANMPHSGGKNYAQEILDKSQQRELDAQKENIDKDADDISRLVDADHREYARGQAKIAQMNAAKLQYWNNNTEQIKSVMARTEDQAKLAGMNGVLAYAQKRQIEAEKGYLDHYREVGNHELAQLQAQRAAATAEARKARDEDAKREWELVKDPNFQPTDPNMPREKAAALTVQALRNRDMSAAGFGRVQKEGKPSEQDQTVRAADEFNQQLEDLKKDPIITGTGLDTAALSHLPQRIAPESNDAQVKLDAVNTRMLQAVGKVAKDADGKPNKEMIDRIEKKYEIHLGDSPRFKQQKLQAVQDIVNALSRQQGAANAPLSTKK